jgi:hypothetical protein
MGKVIFDISMSLDGFITAANRRPEEPMGDGGERLHEWAFGDDQRDREPADAPAGGVYTFVTGGAETGRQYLGAGLVDQLSIHLEPIATVPTAAAIHLRFRVAR